MIKRLTVIFCFLWCILLVRFAFLQWNGKMDGQEVISVFKELGLEETKVCLEMTGELGVLSTEKKAVEKLNKAAALLGTSIAGEMTEEEKQNGKIWSIEGFCKLPEIVSEYQTSIKVLAVKDGFFTRYYLQIAITGDADTRQVSIIRKCMEQIKQKEALECMISIRLDGCWNRILSQDEKKLFSEQFLEASGAELAQSSQDENLWMIYAYAKKLGDAVLINQKSINLNLMLRDGQSKTRCFIGVPAVWSDDVSAIQ